MLKLEDIYKKEEKRWRESLEIAYRTLLTIEDLESLVYARTAVSWLIHECFKSIPNLLEENDNRKNWERYLSGLKFLSTSVESSFLIKTTLTMFGLGDAKDKILSWNKEALNLISEIYYVGSRVDEYFNHMSKSVKISGKIELCSLYSSLKTWDTEEKFNIFENKITSLTEKPFEIYIEGPIHLVLMLSKSNFFFLIRAISAKKLTDLIFPKKIEENDLVILNDKLGKMLEESKTLKYFLLLLKETTSLSTKSWVNEQKNRRESLTPTPTSKKRFIKNFELSYFEK